MIIVRFFFRSQRRQVLPPIAAAARPGPTPPLAPKKKNARLSHLQEILLCDFVFDSKVEPLFFLERKKKYRFGCYKAEKSEQKPAHFQNCFMYPRWSVLAETKWQKNVYKNYRHLHFGTATSLPTHGHKTKRRQLIRRKNAKQKVLGGSLVSESGSTNRGKRVKDKTNRRQETLLKPTRLATTTGLMPVGLGVTGR